MSNRVCVFTYDSAEALQHALASDAAIIWESAPEPSAAISVNLPEAQTPGPSQRLISLRSHSAYRYLIARALRETLKRRHPLLGDKALEDMETAIHEAITNAVVHGNLGVTTDGLSPSESAAQYQRVQEALKDPAKAEKHVTILLDESQQGELSVSVSDEGRGFDYAAELAKEPPANLKPHHRHMAGIGVHLLKSLTDGLRFSDGGRHVRMTFALPAAENTPLHAPYPAIVPGKADQPRVLVVDDMDYNRFIIRNILSAHGFSDILEAENGKEALSLAMQYPPNLIISDLSMPLMDGFEFCEAIRRHPQLTHTPIIVQTSLMNVEERIRALEKGANDIIVQPVHSKELIARIEMHLNQAAAYRKLDEYRCRVESEIELARQMHIALLPEAEELERIETEMGIRITNYFEPSFEIGGDIWGVWNLKEKKLAFYQCDFTGHGVGAAINTFRFHAALPSLVKDMPDPDEFMRHMNDLLYDLLPVEQFATFFYGIIDIANDHLRYSCAGAPKPVLYSAAARRGNILNSSGIPLGIVRNHGYPVSECAFEHGDSLFLYSDALIETTIHSLDRFLEEEDLRERLERFLAEPSKHADRQVIRSFMEDLDILEGRRCDDDLTMTLLTRYASFPA